MRSADIVCEFLASYGHNVREGKAQIDEAVEAGTILVKNARSGATLTLDPKGDMAKFKNVLEKARRACENSGQDIENHWLPDIRKLEVKQ
jgi:hypothetical protein